MTYSLSKIDNLENLDESYFGFKTIVSKDKLYSGVNLFEQLSAFFANPNIDKNLKKTLSDYINFLSSEKAIEVSLSSTAAEGQSRAEELWKHGLQGEQPDTLWKDLFNMSRFHSTLEFSETCQTFSAKQRNQLQNQFERGLIVTANPLLSSVLTMESFSKAIAHEEYHHRDNHYKVISEILIHWLNENPSAQLNEKKLARDCAEKAVDFITNRKLNISEVIFDYRPFERGSGRRLLAIAATAGSSLLQNSNGDLCLPLITVERYFKINNIKIDPSFSVKDIFETLLNVDRKAPGLTEKEGINE